jgi:UDP-galactopyranose mutase
MHASYDFLIAGAGFSGAVIAVEEMEQTLARWRVPIDQPKNSDEVIVSQVGYQLYEKFFKNYTREQWRPFPNGVRVRPKTRLRKMGLLRLDIEKTFLNRLGSRSNKQV